ncbi:M20 family metallopeptidase [Paenibacillus glycanilyticus]|uniref:M20 metallopeptidase family protein n=1 Tax=Paenibacillus glycanilyticus TaxID=126569 RepID=UPI00203FB834|nr:M20 family metallopeptidase [Paenibacillus glycanilyticus]MCM3630467.1 M20 family metallopeptidase [Paenibacillus glycanilyticus]
MMAYAGSLHEELVAIRRDLHRHPELLYDTDRTAALVARLLQEWGIDVRTGVGPHFGKGVVGVLRGGLDGGRTILLRADMDALPIAELNEIDYKSITHGIMHACGHDAHTAMLLGAAKTLAAYRESFAGEIRFVFQPAEEGALPSPLDGRLLSGGRDMIEAGILQGVDRCYALHVWPELDAGTIGVHPQYAMAASSHFQVTFRGTNGHHSSPHLAADAIQMTAAYIAGVNGMMANSIDPLEQAVLAFGTLRAGTVINAIAEQSVLTGTFRAFSKQTVAAITAGLERHAQAASLSYGGSYDIVLREGIAVVNDSKAIEEVIRAATSVLGRENVLTQLEPSLAGEDFGWYLDQVPGAFVLLGCLNEEFGQQEGLHRPRFNLDEAILVHGTRLLVQLAAGS